jgi:CDP-2,3-bis-(O-geranylgeranyl)-sn-glycerol synthase
MGPERLLELIYLLLPAYCANMAPPFVKFWRGWNRPIHRGWLGDHKTVIGFVSGVLAALLVAYAQSRLEIGIDRLWRPDVWLAVGLAQGMGAMCGDVIKSFFKRRLGIAPGGRWIPADQIDFVLGALVPLVFLVRLSLIDILVMLLLTFVADIAINHLAFRLGIRNTKW